MDYLRRAGWSCTVALVVLGLMPRTATAQFPEDALRFSTPGIGVGARGLGIGNAYNSVANDFSAIYWNPGGLTQLKHGEFSVGFSHLNYQNESSYFGSTLPYSNNSTTLNAFGFAFPVEVKRGAMTIAIGYARENNFTTGLGFDGFNPVSSIIQDYAPDGELAPYDPSGNTMWELYLADVDSTTGRWISPIMDSVTQKGTTIEGGGLDNWSAALAMEIAPGLSAGVTLSYATGSYTYERNYHEIDTRGLYDVLPYDFAELTLDEYVDSDISAFRSKIGFLYRAPDIFRAAFTVRPPAVLVVSENFSTRATAVYDNGDVLPVDGPYTTSGTGAYDVLTPWTFGAGISLVLGPLLVSGDVEYTDWTQMEFRDAAVDLLDLNKEIKTLFRGTFEVRAGAELFIPWPGLRLRGGAMYLPSRYAGDPESFDQKYVTAGVGFLLGSSAMFDVAYAAGWWKSYRSNYGGSSRVDENITTHNILATLSYRF